MPRLPLAAIAALALAPVAACTQLFGVSDLGYGPADGGASAASVASTDASASNASSSSVASSGSGGDGGGDGGAGGVGGAGGAGGGGLGPWTKPTLVAPLASGFTDDDPAFTADRLEVYFNSNRGAGGDYDIYVSKRGSVDEPWGAPAAVTELNSVETDGNIVVTGDGLTLWISSQRTQGAGDIYVSTRSDRSSPWGAPTAVATLNSSASDYPTGISGDGLTMFLDSERTHMGAQGGHDLYVSTRPSLGADWLEPVPLLAFNTALADRQAWLSADALTTYFDRDTIAGHTDIWMSTRATTSDPWADPWPVDDLNSTNDESDAWVSEDGRYMMLTLGIMGSRQIYETSR